MTGEGAKAPARGTRLCPLGLVVALASLVIGCVYALAVPPGAGLDEPMHVARAAQVAQGELLPQEVSADDLDATLVTAASRDFAVYGGQTDRALYELLARGNLSYYQSGDDRAAYALPAWEDERVRVDDEMGGGVVTWAFPNTSVNSPLSYAPHALAYAVATALTSSPWAVVLAMRLAGVLTYALAAYACIALLPVGRWVFAFVALLPTSLAVNSMVTADLMTFASLSLYFCCLLRMLWAGRAGRAEWAVLWASTAALCLAKVTYAPFGLLLLLLPALAPRFRTGRALLATLLVGLSSLALFALWYAQVGGVNTGVIWSADIDPAAQSAHVAADPLGFLSLALVSLARTDLLVSSAGGPFDGVVGGTWLTVVPLAVTLVWQALDLAGRLPRRRVALGVAAASVAVCLLVALLVQLALYLQFNPPGLDKIQGVQARYFLPLVFPLCLSVVLCCVGARGEGRGAASPGPEGGRPLAPPLVASLAMSSIAALSTVAGTFS